MRAVRGTSGSQKRWGNRDALLQTSGILVRPTRGKPRAGGRVTNFQLRRYASTPGFSSANRSARVVKPVLAAACCKSRPSNTSARHASATFTVTPTGGFGVIAVFIQSSVAVADVASQAPPAGFATRTKCNWSGSRLQTDIATASGLLRPCGQSDFGPTATIFATGLRCISGPFSRVKSHAAPMMLGIASTRFLAYACDEIAPLRLGFRLTNSFAPSA